MPEFPGHIASSETDHAQLYKLLVSELTDFVVFLTDPEGRIVTWNRGVERILLYPEDEWIGQSITIIFTPEDRASDQPRLEMAKAESEGRAPEIRSHLRRDGSRFFVDGTTVALKDATGKLLGFSKVLRDITAQKQAELELAQRARLATLGADVGAALTQMADLSAALNRCAQAIVDHLDAAFARIWTLSPAEDVLELQASAGMYTQLDGPHGRIPVGAFKIGKIAQERRPHLTNDVANDARISDPAWARREGMVAFAGYPLLVEDRLVGVLGLFARHPLANDTLNALGSVAASISVGIERKRTEAALRESEGRFRTTFSSAPTGMVITTLEGLLIETNQAYRDFTGFSSEELARTEFLQLAHPDDLPHNQELFSRLLAGDIPSYTIEKRYRCKDGRYTWVRATAALLRDSHGDPREIIGLVEDISDRKHSEEERERLLGELARSNDELSRFAHVAAHDLRSPLRTIRSYTQLLERRLRDQLNDSTREFMGMVLDGADRMGQLIDALLYYAQVGQDVAEREPVSMDTVVADAVTNLATLIDESHAKVQYGELPTVVGDGVQLVQLMQNLIANAIKYSRPEAPPQILLSARNLNDIWAFAVEDNGQGIPADYRDEVFAPLKRLHGSEVPGTGMGLAVCKKIVERHGGRIWVESEVGAGSTFHFTLAREI